MILAFHFLKLWTTRLEKEELIKEYCEPHFNFENDPFTSLEYPKYPEQDVMTRYANGMV